MNFMQKLLIARQAEISYRRAQLAPPRSSALRSVVKWLVFGLLALKAAQFVAMTL